MTTEAVTMPFRCAACGPIDSVNLVKDASVWHRVRLDAGAVIAELDWDLGEEDGTARLECPTCCGDARMADGAPIVVEDWV